MSERGRSLIITVAILILCLWNVNLNLRLVKLQGSVQKLQHQQTSSSQTKNPIIEEYQREDSNQGKASGGEYQESDAGQDLPDRTVYITRSGHKYHGDGCRFLSKSKIPIFLKEAQDRGYTPCSVCGGG